MNHQMVAQVQKKNSKPSASGVQRKCDKCREEDKLLQRSAIGSAPKTVPPIVHEVLQSPGQPLDATTRECMESRFGHDFSLVRVHNGSKAAESAQAVNARAYTIGEDVVFGSGQYQPELVSGQQLLAHELTHVVQRQNRDYNLARISQPDDIAEIEAAKNEDLSHLPSLRNISSNNLSQTLMRHPDGKGQVEQQEKSPGFWGSIAGGLMGEFKEDPSFAMIGVDLGVSLIPILDQVSDVRDIIAHLYYLIVREQYDRFMRWVGLVFTLIGLFPEIGSAIKGASKYIFKGARDVISHLVHLLRPLRRILPEIVDIGRFRRYIARNWDRFFNYGSAIFNRQVDRVSRWVDIASKFISRRLKSIREGLVRIREIAPRKLGEAFAWVKKKIDDVLAQASEALGRSGLRTAEEIPPVIPRSLGAASRVEMLAKKVGMNIDSKTTQHILGNVDMKVEEFIGKFRKGNIKEVFPEEFMKLTIEQALTDGKSTVRKLLTNTEYYKFKFSWGNIPR